MVKNQIRTQRNVEEKVSLITCMCPVGCLSVVGKSDWFSYTTSPSSRLLHGDEQDVLCHSGHPGLCLRSRFEKNISYLFELTRLHGYHSGDLFFLSFLNHFLTLGTLCFSWTSACPRLNITTFSTSLISRDSFSSSLDTPLLICTTLDAASTQSTLSLSMKSRQARRALTLTQKKTTPRCS